MIFFYNLEKWWEKVPLSKPNFLSCMQIFEPEN